MCNTFCKTVRCLSSCFCWFKWCPGAESNHRHEDFQWRWLKIHIRKHMLKYAKRICAKNVFNRKRAVSYFYRQNHSGEHCLSAELIHKNLNALTLTASFLAKGSHLLCHVSFREKPKSAQKFSTDQRITSDYREANRGGYADRL